MKLLIIYNPQAAHGRAANLKDEILERFQSKNIECHVEETMYHGHGISLAAKADLTLYSGIVAAGGDGTLFETVTGYFKNNSFTRPPLGILPIGTGNAFARDMEVTVPQWDRAVDIITQEKTRFVDVGQFDTEDRRFYFLNILGLGFVADVVKIAHRLKWLGNFSYTLGVLHRTLFLNAIPMTIKIDGQEMKRECVFVEISNTRYTSNFYMAPEAKIDDGYLDVTLLGKMNRRKLLASFPKIFTGEHVDLPEVEQIKAKRIQIDTDVPKVLTPDGELLGRSPVTIACLHQAIEVYWP